jgi:DNA polymerase (family 10)
LTRGLAILLSRFSNSDRPVTVRRMDNDGVAEILDEIGTLLEIKGENPFKTRAYQNGSRTIEGLTEPLAKIIEEDRLKGIKGIGKALQEKVTTLATTGGLPYYDELKASVPPGLIEMLKISGLGPKKIKAIHSELGIDTVAGLETACTEGRLAALAGFGKKTELKILESLDFLRKFGSKHRIDEALAVAEPILESLRSHPDVIRCSIAGSLRRWKETIGDVDFLVSSTEPTNLIEFFTNQPGILSVLAKGETKASLNLEGGIQADLRVVADGEFASALAYFTGSKEHNIVMRQRAIERGLRLNEYGLFRSQEETRDPELRLDCRTEEDIFKALDLTYVPPELREDKGEIAAAEKGELPELLRWTELKGSLHNHSNWSDGKQTLAEVAALADGLGCAYWAITDHSRSSHIANGLDEKRMEAQLVAIAEVNASYEKNGSDFRLLSGSEVDILAGGKLDYDDDLLAQLDCVVASIHQGFGGTEEEMSRRLIRAAENPNVQTLGHITGRLLLTRDAYKINQHAVIDACAETGTWIELNASPYRMDMDWRLWQYAREKGVRCVINCDAHSAAHFGFLRLGAGVARKGWLTRKDVVNTMTLKQLREALARKRS